jgi:t-SNARE complex subunit (syntaxin)
VVAVRRGRLDAELKERQEVKSRRCLFSYRSQARNVQLNAHEAIRSLNSVFLLASLLN